VLLFGIFLKKGPGYKINNNIGTLKILKVTLKGWKDLFLNFSSLFKKRLYIQKRKKISNEDIKKWFQNDRFSMHFLESIYK
jgi:hypothetical protein